MTDPQSPETNPASDRGVEETLTDALSTPPLGEERLARIREAVAQEWRAATAGSSDRPAPTPRSRWVAYAVAASIAAVTIALWVTKPSTPSVSIGSISRLNNAALEVRSGLFQHRKLVAGDALRVGDRLTTSGSMLVNFARGGTLRIAAESRLSVTATTQLSLERGLIYLDFPPASTASNPLRITTKAGAVEHVGTEFEVMSDDHGVRIRVREGRIRFLGKTATLVAGAGTELYAMPGAQISQRSIDTYGRDWLWTAALAPDYEIDGHPLIDYLRWVSRELGRPLDFADAKSRQIADHTILHGSVRGQASLDALSNVLATT